MDVVPFYTPDSPWSSDPFDYRRDRLYRVGWDPEGPTVSSYTSSAHIGRRDVQPQFSHSVDRLLDSVSRKGRRDVQSQFYHNANKQQEIDYMEVSTKKEKKEKKEGIAKNKPSQNQNQK
jgi:hypothetical protein